MNLAVFIALGMVSTTSFADNPITTGVIASSSDVNSGVYDPVMTGGTILADGTVLTPTISLSGTANMISPDLQSTLYISSLTDGDSAGSVRFLKNGLLGTIYLGASGSETYSYTGSTTIDNGLTVVMYNQASLASSEIVVVDGALNYESLTHASSLKSLVGGNYAQVILGANDLSITNSNTNDGAYYGTISGTGALFIIGGTETLSGTNTYTGATSVGSGATLVLGSGGSIASTEVVIDSGGILKDTSGGLAAKSLVTNNGTLILGADESIASLTSTGNLDLEGKTLTLTNATGDIAGSFSFGSLNIAGGNETMSGTGTLIQTTTIGTGATFNLTGSNDARTVLINGTLNDTSGGLSSHAVVTNNGNLTLGANQSIRSISGSGNVDLGSNTLTQTEASGTFSGVISGTGALTISSGT